MKHGISVAAAKMAYVCFHGICCMQRIQFAADAKMALSCTPGTLTRVGDRLGDSIILQLGEGTPRSPAIIHVVLILTIYIYTMLVLVPFKQMYIR